MTEDFLQYIWQHRLFLPEGKHTSEGERVEILQTGQRNTNAGPDFTDVRVQIGETLWAGCVEVHLRSSDWERHGHHNDPAYNNVVLHVVYQNDADVYNAQRQLLPVMELHFDQRYFENYNRLILSKEAIVCQDDLSKIDEFTLAAWFERLAIERLEQKAESIMKVFAATCNNWEETLYRQLARNFGFSLNALPFEALSKSLPLNTLLINKNNLRQIEALLFGQAGMLDDEIKDEYYDELSKEYKYLQKKYNLKPIDKFLWKFLRLRPINFPTIRIAQFAALFHQNEHLFSKIIETQSVDDLEEIFDLQASDYWNSHYQFGKISPNRTKTFGQTSIRAIIINTVVPFLFVYGKLRGKDDFCARAVNILENIPAERNNILVKWEELGVRNSDAFISQSLLQMYNEYCITKRCLNCAIGNKIVLYDFSKL